MTITAKRILTSSERREIVESEHASVALAGAILAVIGWSGLVWVVTNELPTVPNRWSFYALLHIALTGTALPFVRLLHRRFSRAGGLFVSPGVMVRQATWLGLFGALSAWLRMSRLLTGPVVLIIALGIVAIETLLRVRERTQWRPD